MSEPVSDNLVDAICGLIDSAMDEAVGDYFSHEQADRLRAAIYRCEIEHFAHEKCPICVLCCAKTKKEAATSPGKTAPLVASWFPAHL